MTPIKRITAKNFPAINDAARAQIDRFAVACKDGKIRVYGPSSVAIATYETYRIATGGYMFKRI